MMLSHNGILKQKTQLTKQIKVRDPKARMTQAYL
jgi:hypothetical protein